MSRLACLFLVLLCGCPPESPPLQQPPEEPSRIAAAEGYLVPAPGAIRINSEDSGLASSSAIFWPTQPLVIGSAQSPILDVESGVLTFREGGVLLGSSQHPDVWAPGRCFRLPDGTRLVLPVGAVEEPR